VKALPLGTKSPRSYGCAGMPGGPVADTCAPPPPKRNIVQLAVLALMTLVLALAGQASLVRGAIRASEAQDRTIDGRLVVDDNAVLPGKTVVRWHAGLQGPRATVDHDPPPFMAGPAAGVAALAPAGGARWAVHHDARRQLSGSAYLARGPPTTERWIHDERVRFTRVATLHSVDPSLPLRPAVPSRMMA
jgi:hypothetical protein